MSLCPINGGDQTISEQRNIESEFRCRRIDDLLAVREQIEQQRPEPAVLQCLGNGPIARAMSAASASVRKYHEPTRIGWKGEVAIERDVGEIESDGSRSRGFGWDAHRAPQISSLRAHG
jgi:hypothetical protein